MKLARACAARLRAHRRLSQGLVGVALAAPLLAGGWLLLRDSPLARVEHVRISGVRGPEARAIEATLTGRAREMSTLNVNTAALEGSVARFRIVRALRASAGFPHTLHIAVTEQPPVAVLSSDGQLTAVAADGVVLGPELVSSSLPVVSVQSEPLAGGRVADPRVLGGLEALGAAPRTLAGQVARLYQGPEGLTLQMRGGLRVYFGDGGRPHAKWASLAAVLADPGSAGAAYVDVRLPERPAAGSAQAGVGSAVTAAASGAAAAPVSASDPGTAALAASLQQAVDGGNAANAPAATPAQTAEEPPAEAAGQTSTGAGESAPQAAAGAGESAPAAAATAGAAAAG